MARKRRENPYERTSRILREHRYIIYPDNTFALNNSGVLGKILEDGKLEILASIPEKYKITLEDHSLQTGLKLYFK